MERPVSEVPHPIDVRVGERIRARRKNLGISQTALGDALGLTFQQIQKYERGTNRISASKLFETARVLRVPIIYFFEGADADLDGLMPHTTSNGDTAVSAHELRTLAAAYRMLPSSKIRMRVLELVLSLSEQAAD